MVLKYDMKYIVLMCYSFSYLCFVKMKDILKRIVISIIFGALIWYLLFLFMNSAIIVQWEFLESNNLYYIILLAICVYLFVFFGIYPINIKMTKATLFVMGLALVIIWDTVLTNNSSNYVFVADLFKVVWVLLSILCWTNLLVTDKVKKIKDSKNIEIIEV